MPRHRPWVFPPVSTGTARRRLTVIVTGIAALALALAAPARPHATAISDEDDCTMAALDTQPAPAELSARCTRD